jgi:anaerobic magnesium-protoporphyrin IX monomethyl ester cyclase
VRAKGKVAGAMKIGLVSTYAHPIALGARYVSSYLKTTGHDVVMLFMSSRRDTARVDYGSALLEDFVDRLRDRDLIGLSLATATFHRARVLTEHIRQAGLRAPVIWGGAHPTVAPSECVEMADAACVGPGEEPMLQLVERLEAGRDPTTVPGLWFRAGGPLGSRAARNPPGPLETQLDDLPFPDYELDTHWVAGRDALVPARPENMRGALHTLRVLTARGCPYHCTFCNNTALREVHGNFHPWVRLRSLDNVLAELRQALACFPTIRAINFVDDLFLVRSTEEIEAFADRYNAEVGVPLEIDAFPNTVTERKVRALARLPIQLVSMGIESASDDTLKNVYRRPTTLARIAEAIRLFHRYRLRAEYHYIVSNPYEPDRNVVETMRFIATHHRGPAVLRVFPLMFYPGTPLYQRARADGLVGAQDHAVYDYMGTGALEVAKHDYLAVWLRAVLNLRNVGMPAWVCHRVIDFATHRAVRKLLDRRWFCPAVFVGYQVLRKLIRNCVYQPFIRPFRRLRTGARPVREPVTWRIAALNAAAERRRGPIAVTGFASAHAGAGSAS